MKINYGIQYSIELPECVVRDLGIYVVPILQL